MTSVKILDIWTDTRIKEILGLWSTNILYGKISLEFILGKKWRLNTKEANADCMCHHKLDVNISSNWREFGVDITDIDLQWIVRSIFYIIQIYFILKEWNDFYLNLIAFIECSCVLTSLKHSVKN